jgi:predicted ATP-grasp superfamily ATP-dependent carboligase
LVNRTEDKHLTSTRERLVQPEGEPAPTAACQRKQQDRSAIRAGRALDALLLDSEHRQTLAAVRSLGKRGVRVGAAGDNVNAASCQSRWCTFKGALPSVEAGTASYSDAVLRLIEQHHVGVLIPMYDGSIEALRLRRPEIEARVRLALASEEALAIAVSKEQTLRLARALDIPVPEGITISSLAEVAPAMRHLGSPVVVKPAQSWADNNGAGSRLSPSVAVSLHAAEWAADHMLSRGTKAILQEWLPGRREAVSLFYANDRLVARFAQVSHREWPLLGGCSVFCEGIGLPSDTTNAAEGLVRAMGLEGPSMVEFRRNRAGAAVLMEVNPRMGGSVALAIASGVDFPGLTYDWAMGRPLKMLAGYQPGRRSRWLAGDLFNLKCALQQPAHPDSPGRRRAIGGFLSDVVLRPSAIEPFSLHDPRPWIADLHTVVIKRVGSRLSRISARGAREGVVVK